MTQRQSVHDYLRQEDEESMIDQSYRSDLIMETIPFVGLIILVLTVIGLINLF